MGSLESGIPGKRETGWSKQQHPSFLQRNRSRSFLLLKRFTYLQLICSIAVFFFFVLLFQFSLPALVSDKPPPRRRSSEKEELLLPPDMLVFKERGVLSFGQDVNFEPTKLLMSFHRDAHTVSSSDGFNTTTLQRFGFRNPNLALVSFFTPFLYIHSSMLPCNDCCIAWFSLFFFL